MMKKDKNHIKIHSMCLAFLCVGLFLFFVEMIGLNTVYQKYKNLLTDSENYVFAQKDLQDLKQSFDAMTDYARQYILTLDFSCVRLYFQEKHEMLSQKTAEDDLRARFGGIDTRASIMLAEIFEYERRMEERELKSLRLACEIAGIDESMMSEELRACVLSGDEISMSDVELEDAAYAILFGHEYAELKKFVNTKLITAANAVFLQTQQRRISNKKIFYRALVQQCLLSFFIIVLIALSVGFIAFFVLRPLQFYVVSIKNSKPLRNVAAGAELTYLAETYNKMYQMNTTVRKELQRQASYDAITGLLNRTMFEQLCAFYKGVTDAIAFLIVDVDNFKQINDCFGHEIGDIALKHVSELLKELAGKNGKAFRIGGDEFALILQGVAESEGTFLGMKITEMNETLKNPESQGFPKLSVSVGISFSDEGYSTEMYSHADRALYRTKANGRCGFSLYTPELDDADKA